MRTKKLHRAAGGIHHCIAEHQFIADLPHIKFTRHGRLRHRAEQLEKIVIAVSRSWDQQAVTGGACAVHPVEHTRHLPCANAVERVFSGL